MEKIKLIDGTEAMLVVRCKECVEYDDEWCLYWQNVVNAYDFCSYGERKESSDGK